MATNDKTPKVGRRTKKAIEKTLTPESPSMTISVGSPAQLNAPRPKVDGVNDPALNKQWRIYNRARKAMPGVKRVQPVDPARNRKKPGRKSVLPAFQEGGSKNTVNTFNLTTYAGTDFRYAPHARNVIDRVNQTGRPEKISLRSVSGEDMIYDVVPTKAGDNFIDNKFFKNHKTSESKDFESDIPRIFDEGKAKNIPDVETARALKQFIGTAKGSKANENQVKKTLRKPNEFISNTLLDKIDWEAKPPGLKCGGIKKGKTKRMADGGEKKADLLSLLFGEGEGAGGLVSMGGSMVGDVLSAGFGSSAEEDLAGIRSNQNPATAMAKAAKKQRTGSALSGAAKGAAAGATMGPVGALVGGALGLGTSLIKNIFNKKASDRAIEEAEDEYNQKSAASYGATQATMSYKKGGKIKGKGGPKEDAIDMKIPDGSFIVPTENSAEAMEIGQAYLDWPKDAKVGKDQGGDKVNVSNGEVYFSPDEVDMLKFYGVSLDALAPNSDPDKKAGFKDGGEVEPWMKDPSHFKSPEEESYYESNQLPEEANEESVKKKKDYTKILENIPEIMSGIQVAAGAAGLALSKRSPDPVVASELRTLVRETKKLSETGMDPSTKNFALKKIESGRRSAINEIVARGGTPTEIMAGMTNITSKANEAVEGLAVADTETRLRNKSPYLDALRTMSGRKDEVSKEKRSIKEAKEAAYAALFQAGISNMIGAKEYKDHLDYLKNLKTQPSITLG